MNLESGEFSGANFANDLYLWILNKKLFEAHKLRRVIHFARHEASMVPMLKFRVQVPLFWTN